jgi:hypothetical protein
MKSTTISLDPIKTEGIKAILKLAETSVECSSYLAIRGPRGTGKTEAYKALSLEWTNVKSPPTAFYFQCMPDGTSYGFFRDLVQHLTKRKFEPRENPGLRDLIDMVHVALSSQRTVFLFLDDIEHLDPHAWNMVRMMYETVRLKGTKLGMAVTDSFATPQFRDGRWDPSLLEAVHLKACDRDFMMAVFTDWEPRLKELARDYYRGEDKAMHLAEVLFERTRGNFRAMDSLVRVLRSNLRPGQATEKDIRKCLSLRTVDPDPMQLKFQLMA